VTAAEWITIAAIIIGPMVAVAITLWIERRRKQRETKLITLRMLLTTRDFPSDPSFQVAIKLVPVEFDDCSAVLSAHRAFLEAANVNADGKSQDEQKAIAERTTEALVRLLFEMSRAVGLKIKEDDIQKGSFGTRGFLYRDALLQDSQRAMRDIATILAIQTKLLAQQPVTPEDGKFVDERLPKPNA
jgi:hypothetical protein